MLLNEQQFLQAAGRLAERAVAEVHGPPRQQAAFLYKQAALREPDDKTLQTLLSAYNDFRTIYRDNPTEAKALLASFGIKHSDKVELADLAAWAVVANIVLNLDEIITKG
jgi:hypothetical protein